ncbi:MAG: hypothetical protein IT381_20365 [Deltaproteobacteria bacterium]|nr:hypothetical protein [Deltaproteobacteria bacterium]
MTGVRPLPQPGPKGVKQAPPPNKWELIGKISAHPAYKALKGDDKARADEIISYAFFLSPRGEYYLSKLLLLLNTPDNPPAKTADAQTKQVDRSVKAAQASRKLDGRTWYVRFEQLVYIVIRESQEEAVSNDPKRKWTVLQNDGTRFLVDRSDPKNIMVKVKVKVNATPDMVARVHRLEDAIEKHLRIKGLVVDLVFVDKAGPDVFEVDADPKGWTTSGNWVGTANGLSHELGHLLGLDDEYDYIESHAANRDMHLGDRLHWFTVEMWRIRPKDGDQGFMSNHDNLPLDRHACEIAQLPVDTCVEARTGKKYSKYGAHSPAPAGPLPPPPRR